MSYKALYRIYRPQSFEEVAGQKHITQTLMNALKNDRVAHAYLFSGPRGTGKTSIAKIFAKAVNCKEAPIDNPCNECEYCTGITDGTISDVIEIDAASNNGVDEIREIRDKVKYLPGYVKYKVYIIDEVHMLSTGAFNALLKTLEEPPQHVIFILCTTEPQKIPATIHSRCQRFDFKSISQADIIDKLFEVAEQENIEITEEAVKQIANYADGGLRDAISLLDQVCAYSPEHIELDDVNEICGTVSLVALLDMVDAIIHSEPAKAIKLLSELLSEGKELKQITLDLIDFFKNLLVYKTLNKMNDYSVYNTIEEFKNFAKEINNKRLFNILDILNQTLNELNWSNQSKTYLELAFLKMTDKEQVKEVIDESLIETLTKRIDELESGLSQPKVFMKSQQENNDVKEEKPVLSKVEDVEIEKPEVVGEVIDEDNSPNEEIKEVEEEKIDEKTITVEPEDISHSYDIHFVEDVLNNGDVEDRKYLNDEWKDFQRGLVDKDDKYLASLLESGQVVASRKNKIIITFSSATICNKLMVPDNQKIIKQMFKNKFNRDMEYMSLPTSVFEMVTKEFIAEYKKGVDYIHLTQINGHGLKDVSQVENKIEETREAKIVSDAKKLFGNLVREKD